jgi:hypothetical protein
MQPTHFRVTTLELQAAPPVEDETLLALRDRYPKEHALFLVSVEARRALADRRPEPRRAGYTTTYEPTGAEWRECNVYRMRDEDGAVTLRAVWSEVRDILQEPDVADVRFTIRGDRLHVEALIATAASDAHPAHEMAVTHGGC